MAIVLENNTRSAEKMLTAFRPDNVRISLFCGGRGSASLIRNLVQLPSVDLSLLVNAYDDGLSTGDLRDFIPGMLGPSDFRKNLSYIIDLYSEGQYALQKLLEFRLPKDITEAQVDALSAFAGGCAESKSLLPNLAVLFSQAGRRTEGLIKNYLDRFFEYAKKQPIKLKYADCSLGNLVFAGAFLDSSNNFNKTSRELAGLFGSQARLVNVCRGDARTLVALKENGDILGRESEIVGPQNASPIGRFFFVDSPLSKAEIDAMAGLSIEEKAAQLQKREQIPMGSAEALEAIENADIVIFGPGTQHSSLLPSYRIQGIGDALRRSRARIKAFVVNLHADHDIPSFDAQRLIDTALNCLGDNDNAGRVITHILYNINSQTRGGGIRLPQPVRDAGMSYKGAQVIEDHFENPVDTKVHSGSRVISTVFDLFYRWEKSRQKETLDIYVDLVGRSAAVDAIVQEFSEIEWRDAFEKVNLILNASSSVDAKLPPHLTITRSNRNSDFSEVAMLKEWLEAGTGDCFATLTGDGEYRLSDIFIASAVLNGAHFGAVYGSRTQSRHQFRSSLHAAYGEKTFLYCLSFLGAFVLSFVFAVICGRIFTDPLTGFRLYHRRHLPPSLEAWLQNGRARSAAAVTREIMRQGVEIGEVPVYYRTFRDFSKASWRLMRGMRNLVGIFG